jgi:hypothetical protein
MGTNREDDEPRDAKDELRDEQRPQQIVAHHEHRAFPTSAGMTPRRGRAGS